MSAAGRRRFGILTPSSNTVLEPVTTRILSAVPGMTAHFARFRVTEIALGQQALDQFASDTMLAAVDLLADAHCHAVCWSGTSAGWLGFETDRRLCRAIETRIRVPACSAVLALDEVFRATGVTRFGLVSPYTDDVVAAVAKNFESEGYACVAERHAGMRRNFDFSTIGPRALAGMVRDVAKARAQAVVVLCTNLDGASLAEALEREIGVPVYDSIALAVWASLRAAGVNPALVQSWGRLFREVR